MRTENTFNPRGNLQIFKVYPDGRKDLHWEDHNVITSGMGLGLGYLFSELGSTNILDYQIKYFQLGVSGGGGFGTSTVELSSPVAFSSVSATDLVTDQHSQLKNGTTVTDVAFCTIAANNIYKVAYNTVKYNLVVPDNAANLSLPINEVGLFMKNPRGQSPQESILVAYRSFTNLLKTSDFTVLFVWSITF